MIFRCNASNTQKNKLCMETQASKTTKIFSGRVTLRPESSSGRSGTSRSIQPPREVKSGSLCAGWGGSDLARQLYM